MACFNPTLFTSDASGNFTLDWENNLPYCDQRTLPANCTDEQSVHFDPVSGKLWGDPTACRFSIRRSGDIGAVYITGGTEELAVTGNGVFQNLGTNFDVDVENPSDCLPAVAMVHWCFPDIESRFGHNGNTSNFTVQYQLDVGFSTVKDGILHRHTYASPAADLDTESTPGGTVSFPVTLAPGATRNIRIVRQYSLTDNFNDANDRLPTRIVVDDDLLNIEVTVMKDC